MFRYFHFLAVAVGLGALSLAPPAVAMGGGDPSPSTPSRAVDPDYTMAEKAVKAENWNEAIELLTRAVARDDRNPNIYNYLGYAERHRGNLSAAFKYYDQALALDPKHRGAHEYLGEAHLMAGNLPKAEEQLAALDKICFFSCEEYRELKEKIAQYKDKHK